MSLPLVRSLSPLVKLVGRCFFLVLKLLLNAIVHTVTKNGKINIIINLKVNLNEILNF